MSYYYKTKNIKFSSNECVRYIMKYCDGVSKEKIKNDIRKFNSHISTIINSPRYLTEKTMDGNDTYFYGVLIHRRLTKGGFDIYCSSKAYAYFVITNFAKFAHDEYEKIYSIFNEQWNKFENGISLHPIEERIELYTNLERNFRFTMINRLSEIIDEAERSSNDLLYNTYVGNLTGEVVKLIKEYKAEEEFSEVHSKWLVNFMDICELNEQEAYELKNSFIANFSDYLGTRRPEKEKRIKKECHERIENSTALNILKKKTVAKNLSSEETTDKIKKALSYINETISSISILDIKYKKEHIPLIALMLNEYAMSFIGEQHVNWYYKRSTFCKAIEEKLNFDG